MTPESTRALFIVRIVTEAAIGGKQVTVASPNEAEAKRLMDDIRAAWPDCGDGDIVQVIDPEATGSRIL